MKLSTAIRKGYTRLRKAEFPVKQGAGAYAVAAGDGCRVCAFGCAIAEVAKISAKRCRLPGDMSYLVNMRSGLDGLPSEISRDHRLVVGLNDGQGLSISAIVKKLKKQGL